MTNTDSLLWTCLNAAGHRINCVARFAMGGVQAEILSDGSPLVRRLFPNGAEATAWADAERDAWDGKKRRAVWDEFRNWVSKI